jgi:hypothetical protein
MYRRLGKDPKNPAIYGVGSFAAPSFEVLGFGLIGEMGPTNHLPLVNFMGDRVARSPSVCVRLVRSIFLQSLGLPEIQNQENMVSLGLAQGSWVIDHVGPFERISSAHPLNEETSSFQGFNFTTPPEHYHERLQSRLGSLDPLPPFLHLLLGSFQQDSPSPTFLPSRGI